MDKYCESAEITISSGLDSYKTFKYSDFNDSLYLKSLKSSLYSDLNSSFSLLSPDNKVKYHNKLDRIVFSSELFYEMYVNIDKWLDLALIISDLTIFFGDYILQNIRDDGFLSLFVLDIAFINKPFNLIISGITSNNKDIYKVREKLKRNILALEEPERSEIITARKLFLSHYMDKYNESLLNLTRSLYSLDIIIKSLSSNEDICLLIVNFQQYLKKVFIEIRKLHQINKSEYLFWNKVLKLSKN